MATSPSKVNPIQDPTPQNKPEVFQKYLVGIDETPGSKVHS